MGVNPPQVCVFGSANMDLVAMVERAPELGETVTGRRFVKVPGGKGANQALAAARAGAAVRMLGAVGDDPFGADIRHVLETDGVDVAGLVNTDTPTGTAHIVVDDEGANSIVVVPGANGTVRSLTDEHRAAVASSDVLLLQLELPLEAVTEAARWAGKSDTRVVLTPSPVVPLPPDLLAAVDLLVPNQHEVARLTGEPDPARGARSLLERGVRAVAVTLGERGCLYVDAEANAIEVPAPRVDAVDTTAAGDTFVGCLTVAQADGRDLRDALSWATAAAALSVQRVGASGSMPYRTQVDAEAGRTIRDETSR